MPTMRRCLGPLHRFGFACASCMDGKSMQASPSGGGEASLRGGAEAIHTTTALCDERWIASLRSQLLMFTNSLIGPG